MKGLISAFPFKPLTAENIDSLRPFLGGVPYTPETLDYFYRLNGLPMLPVLPHRPAIRRASQEIGNKFSNVDYGAAKKSFQRGALLYAGVVGFIGTVDSIPQNNEVFSQITEGSPYTLGWEMFETIKHDCPQFCSLIDELSSALETIHEPSLHTLTIMGAGIVHLCLKESVADQELSDLESLFELPAANNQLD